MNKDVLKKYENEKYLLEIIRDEDSENPRNWDNIWTLSMDNYDNCFFGDIEGERKYYSQYNALEKLARHLEIDLEKEIYDEENDDYYMEDKEMEELSEEIQKLGLLKSLNVRGRYTHKVSISRDLDLDDSEGYAFVSFKKIEYEYGIVNDENIGKALSYLEGEIGDYNKWLSGDVYGFMLYKKVKCECCSHIEYEDLDSCWCFYGDDMEINGMLESIGLSSEELDELLKEENEEVA